MCNLFTVTFKKKLINIKINKCTNWDIYKFNLFKNEAHIWHGWEADFQFMGWYTISISTSVRWSVFIMISDGTDSFVRHIFNPLQNEIIKFQECIKDIVRALKEVLLKYWNILLGSTNILITYIC